MATNESHQPHTPEATMVGGTNVGEPETLRVSSGSQATYITVDTILYLLLVLGIFLTAAVVDEAGDGPGFSADTAWFYVVLLSIGFMVSRGLARINTRSDHRAA
ncbi:MAG: hypothetical protein WCB95_12645 [Aeromicrobium sp.]